MDKKITTLIEQAKKLPVVHTGVEWHYYEHKVMAWLADPSLADPCKLQGYLEYCLDLGQLEVH